MGGTAARAEPWQAGKQVGKQAQLQLVKTCEHCSSPQKAESVHLHAQQNQDKLITQPWLSRADMLLDLHVCKLP